MMKESQETTASQAIVDHDDQLERQDLSAADEQELRTFIEKRKWFELKLEQLQSLPPVFPFLDPVLEPATESPDGYKRQSKSTWSFPTKIEVETWIKERDSLEEQVEVFDGGDMERMKEKTRQVTRVPLTQPSTDLVEVTLDLILLIDRLLKILQHREAVLDLFILRIQWDDLRWQVMREIQTLHEEVAKLVRGRGRWEPPSSDEVVNGMDWVSLRDGVSSIHGKELSFHTPPKRSLPLPISASAGSLSELIPPSPTSIHTSGSPTRSAHTQTPKRSLHLPILHSQLVTLQSKHRQLTDGILAKSGTVIDKMIDSAVALKGLGGVSKSPDDNVNKDDHKDENQSGAVPDELIDLQEQLEMDMKEAGGRVAWCRQLEDQWKRADIHYAASVRSRDLARNALNSFILPPTTDELSHLEHLVSTATATLPLPIDDSFPRPLHPAFPAIVEHNDFVVSTLKEAHAEASTALDLARKGLAFYKSLLASRSALLDQKSVVGSFIELARNSLEIIRNGTDDVKRPMFDVLLKEENRPWLDHIPKWTKDAEAICNKAGDAAQRALITVIRHRKEKAAPRALRDYIEDTPDPLPSQVESNADLLRILTDELRQAIIAIRQDAIVHQLVDRLQSQIQEVETRSDNLTTDIDHIIIHSAWPASRTSKVITLDRAILQKINTVLSEAKGTMTELDSMMAMYSRTLPVTRSRLISLLEQAEKTMKSLNQKVDIADRVRQQAEVTRTIEEESTKWTNALEQLRQSLGEATFTQDLSAIKDSIAVWSSSLPGRAIFVSDAGISITQAWTRDKDKMSILPQSPMVGSKTTSASHTIDPMPPSLTPGIPQAFDLEALDHRVRSHINQVSAIVLASLHHLQADRDQLDEWRKQHDEAVKGLKWNMENLTQFVGQASQGVNNVIDRLEKCGTDYKSFNAIELELKSLLETTTTHGTTVVENTSHAIELVQSSIQDKRDDEDTSEGSTLIEQANQLIASYQANLNESFAIQNQIQSSLKALENAFEQKLDELRSRLAVLDLHLLINPNPEDLKSDPLLRRLPTQKIANAVRTELASIHSDTLELDNDDNRVQVIVHDLISAESMVPKLNNLVDFIGSVKGADAALSKLLDALDENSPNDAALTKAKEAVDLVTSSAKELNNDPRVSSEARRVLRTWHELESIAQNSQLQDDDPASDTFSIAESVSTISRVSRIPSSLSLARTGSTLSSITNRSTSHPGQPTFHLSTESSRARTVLETSSGSRLHNLRSSAGSLPRSRKIPTQASTPRARSRGRNSASPNSAVSGSPGGSVGGSPVVAGGSDSSTPSGIPRSTARKSLPNTWVTPTVTPNVAKSREQKYIPNPKSKLDVAVGKVVNKLNVNVPIEPLGLNSNESNVQSGKYWIGAQGRAKLCFCRILRSRTVMVRVGGGWVELSQFLLDHFADAIGLTWGTPIDATKLETPESIRFGWRSTSLISSPTKVTLPISNFHFRTPSQISIPKTPSLDSTMTSSKNRDSISIVTHSDDHNRNDTHMPQQGPVASSSRKTRSVSGPSTIPLFTPPRSQQSTHPSSQSQVSPGGKLSPLIPLHFLKRASESPSVRDKERETVMMTRERG